MSSVPKAPENASCVARSASTSFLGDSSTTFDVSTDGRGTEAEEVSFSTEAGRGTDVTDGRGTETGSSFETSTDVTGFSGVETGSIFFSWTGNDNPSSMVEGSAASLARREIGSACPATSRDDTDSTANACIFSRFSDGFFIIS